MKSLLLPALLVSALASSGCGKSHPNKAKATEPEPEPSSAALDAPLPTAAPELAPLPCQQPKPSADSLLDDFEDGDSILALVAQRNGSWFVATDGTNGAKVHPGPGPANPERLVPARCESLFALHFSGQGFVTWGAVVGAVLHFDRRSTPIDLSAHQGIRFWIRRGFQHTGVVRLNIEDAGTHPDGGQCADPAVRGRTACWNSYGVDMPVLSEDWEERRVPFSTLTQKIPEPSPQPLDTTHIHRVSLKASPGNPFDIWVDDISMF